MKFIALILLLTSFGATASTVAKCHLVEGIYTNSDIEIRDIALETYADIFTIRNAATISFKLNNKELRFIRTEMIVDRHTQMHYLEKSDQAELRAMYITLDRTPRSIAKSHYFFGNMIISPKIPQGGDYTAVTGKDSLNYNFFCSF